VKGGALKGCKTVLPRIVAKPAESKFNDIDVHEAAVLAERGLLGSLLTFPELWPHCADLTTDDFLLTAHQDIFGALCRLHEDQRPADLSFIPAELDDISVVIYAASLVDGTIPDRIDRYVREVKSRAALRRAQHQIERLPNVRSVSELRSHLAMISELLREERGTR
jgi:replicative DNA helicase